jgi:hypothetical protein
MRVAVIVDVICILKDNSRTITARKGNGNGDRTKKSDDFEFGVLPTCHYLFCACGELYDTQYRKATRRTKKCKNIKPISNGNSKKSNTLRRSASVVDGAILRDDS